MVTCCPKKIIVPIILMPGIMGSRLKRKRGDGARVWDPDDRAFTVGRYIYGHSSPGGAQRAAAARKALLVGGPTFQGNDHLEAILTRPGVASRVMGTGVRVTPEREENGWYSVVWSFYGDALRYLDGSFQSSLRSYLADQRPDLELLQSPVFAIGYNWTASNAASGVYAAGKAREYIAAARNYAASQGAECTGALLMTHSMGGFVARAACQLSGLAGDVLAVFSNAMPTDGAPATYKRFHFGFENPGRGMQMADLEYIALGRAGDMITAVLGHLPGPQELLPNKRFSTNGGGSQWLVIKDTDGSVFQRLPVHGNPYTEIYRNEAKFYRACNPGWLFPERTGASRSDLSDFDTFASVNTIAERFHDRIGGAASGYHPRTFLSHSDSATYLCWDRIEWDSSMLGSWLLGRRLRVADLAADAGYSYQREWRVIGTEAGKELEGRTFGADWQIAAAASNGDGTVPISSGTFATGVPAARRPPTSEHRHTSGYLHAASVGTTTVQRWFLDQAKTVLKDLNV